MWPTFLIITLNKCNLVVSLHQNYDTILSLNSGSLFYVTLN